MGESGSGVCGEHLTWTLAGGILTISGSGAMYDYKCGGSFIIYRDAPGKVSPWEAYQEEIRAVNVLSGVTAIGSYAFFNFDHMTRIDLPGTLTAIGDYAFSYCQTLKEITLPEGITSIGVCAFSACSGLTRARIPDSVTVIGENAFWACVSLAEIRLPKKLRRIAPFTFFECGSLLLAELPDSLTSIGEHAFHGCKKLKEIRLPDGIAEIKDGVFADCESLTAVNLSDRITAIGKNAFAGTGLKTVSLPRGLALLGENAFGDVEEVVLYDDSTPDTVGQVGAKLITVKSAQTGWIRYKVYMGAGECRRQFRELWDHTAFNFTKQDMLFPEIDETWSRYMIARTRLEYPYILSPRQHTIYTEYLYEVSMEIVPLLILGGKTEDIIVLEKLGAIRRGNIDALIDYAVRKGKTEITAQLMEFRNRMGSDEHEFEL